VGVPLCLWYAFRAWITHRTLRPDALRLAQQTRAAKLVATAAEKREVAASRARARLALTGGEHNQVAAPAPEIARDPEDVRVEAVWAKRAAWVSVVTVRAITGAVTALVIFGLLRVADLPTWATAAVWATAGVLFCLRSMAEGRATHDMLRPAALHALLLSSEDASQANRELERGLTMREAMGQRLANDGYASWRPPTARAESGADGQPAPGGTDNPAQDTTPSK